MTREEVVASHDRYRAMLARVTARQDMWNSSTMAFVEAELEAYAADMPPIDVVADSSCKNFSTVCLCYRVEPTRIIMATPRGGFEGCVREGGRLFYSQVYNGKILVGIAYPYVAGLQEKKPNKALALVDPEEITKEKILEHVGAFVAELIAAEAHPSVEELARRPIGFASES